MTFYSHDYATKVVDWVITDVDFQNTLTSLLPTGVTAPSPVTTTLCNFI